MDSAQRLSIHIPVWNHAIFLPACLSALEGQTWPDFQAVVIDNASQDEGSAWVREHQPNAVVLRNFKPLSFARAHNQAIAFAFSRWPKDALKDRFILLLDPDVILSPETVERMIRAMVSDPAIAVAGPRMLLAQLRMNEEDVHEIAYTDQVVSDGVLLAKTRLWHVSPPCPPEADPPMEDKGGDQRGGSGRPFAPPFGCLLLRASSLFELSEKGECLDDRFSPEAALVDLVWRLRLLGGKVATLENVRVWKTMTEPVPSKKSLTDRLRLAQEASLLSKKNDPTSNKFFHAPWLVWNAFVRWALKLIQPMRWFRRGPSVKGLRDARREISAKTKVTAKEARGWFD